MKAHNYSHQREAIIHFLSTRKDHPTAEVIYSELKKDMPNLSLGTVYRNLNLLANMGRIKKFSALDGSEHFDGNAAPHQHLICTECGSVDDIDIGDTRFLNKQASENYGSEISEHEIFFYGKCVRCKDK